MFMCLIGIINQGADKVCLIIHIFPIPYCFYDTKNQNDTYYLYHIQG